jgi:hypothetical protein
MLVMMPIVLILSSSVSSEEHPYDDRNHPATQVMLMCSDGIEINHANGSYEEGSCRVYNNLNSNVTVYLFPVSNGSIVMHQNEVELAPYTIADIVISPIRGKDGELPTSESGDSICLTPPRTADLLSSCHWIGMQIDPLSMDYNLSSLPLDGNWDWKVTTIMQHTGYSETNTSSKSDSQSLPLFLISSFVLFGMMIVNRKN